MEPPGGGPFARRRDLKCQRDKVASPLKVQAVLNDPARRRLGDVHTLPEVRKCRNAQSVALRQRRGNQQAVIIGAIDGERARHRQRGSVGGLSLPRELDRAPRVLHFETVTGSVGYSPTGQVAQRGIPERFDDGLGLIDLRGRNHVAAVLSARLQGQQCNCWRKADPKTHETHDILPFNRRR